MAAVLWNCSNVSSHEGEECGIAVQRSAFPIGMSGQDCRTSAVWWVPGTMLSLPHGIATPSVAELSISVPLQAHPRRVAKVAKQIEREVGTLLLHDRVSSPH